MFCRQFVVSQLTRKPIQHALFHKSETNSLNSLINGKLLHKYSRQEGASERPIQNIYKAKWLQFGKLGILAASAAAGFTYWTLLDVKAGSSSGQGSGGGLGPSSGGGLSPSSGGGLGSSSSSPLNIILRVALNWMLNRLTDNNIDNLEWFTKDKLKAFCEKNPDQLKFYAVFEKDVNNKVVMRKLSNDEYKKLINEKFDSSFKDEAANWIPLPWWNISSKSVRKKDTRNENLRQFEMYVIQKIWGLQ
ncbi:uncharacterized protein LOC131935742 isoform X2 [Physella acuta]|uniref:uncharacterized protein LOC131935742 isoform X2 n=1 Tax=Physella acuta TaxID=109671 RepID=UPI0027DD71E0|nr:uncharacterized protein LOC131935742 isoform X2 [Physella acuta]